MAAKAAEYAVLTVDAHTGNGAEACRVGSQDVALKIAAQLRYEERRELDPAGGKPKKVKKYERVTTMKIRANGDMVPVVVR
jgi:hypothetical protein